jgi:hypothetical protein
MNPRLNAQMDQIVLKAIANDPAKRYETCEEFREALGSWAKSHLS